MIKIWTLLSVLIRLSSSLHCFQCTKISGTKAEGCPLKGTDPFIWSKNINKYKDIDGFDIECAVGYSEVTKDVYYQSAVSRQQCRSPNFRTTIISKIQGNGASQGDLLCCSVDGCNWNKTTADLSLKLSQFAKDPRTQGPVTGPGGIVQTAGSLENWVIWTIVGAAVLFIVLVCCCCVFCSRQRKKRREKEESMRSRGGTTTLDVGNRHDSRGGVQRIDVAPSPIPGTPRIRPDLVMDSRDHERYSSIDRRIYHRRSHLNSFGSTPLSEETSMRSPPPDQEHPYDSHNKKRIGAVSRVLFDGDDFKSKVTSPERRDPKNNARYQEWQHVWNNAADPNNRRPVVERGSNNNPFMIA